ncbi:glycosyltransferase family 2 protein [Tropicibacter naphthalenivorans]|uniref:Glycosyl transferase family 2 n=1 Tax=Tropicibacter naphthalenivorans TaxID=441103 RepID=A0A0P1G8T0_9RHOB|nr:glycosyltransferase family 2 protein [Tropicibacter naphthalenivorans]CUH78011.1 hypothetical protein TRN7648_01745 [Tropicibacter naphthalenivorans]SMC94227.1 Glycosyl transferase family 2 [Tropicibacter naphthalenivorans]
MTIALASCMRNEGIFLLEWLAFHSALGFDRIVVVTNDCTDGSDMLLDALADMGVVTHIRQDVPDGASPQDAGMDHVLTLCRESEITHVLHIDSDEFLHLPDGTLSDLLERTQDADVVPIPWLALGDSGVTDWTPGDLVLARNTRAALGLEPGVTKFKCLFRVASFAKATDHNPLEPLVDDPQVRSPDGKKLRNGTLYQEKSARFRPLGKACDVTSAFLFHYAVKSQDLFLMKNDRGDGQGKASAKYHLGSGWHAQANRNDAEESSMLAHLPQVEAQIAAWRADPAVASAEQACHNWFITRRAQVLTPENRAAWTRGKATA